VHFSEALWQPPSQATEPVRMGCYQSSSLAGTVAKEHNSALTIVGIPHVLCHHPKVAAAFSKTWPIGPTSCNGVPIDLFVET